MCRSDVPFQLILIDLDVRFGWILSASATLVSLFPSEYLECFLWNSEVSPIMFSQLALSIKSLKASHAQILANFVLSIDKGVILMLLAFVSSYLSIRFFLDLL